MGRRRYSATASSILSRPDGSRAIVVGVARSGRALRRHIRYGESTPSVNRISRNLRRAPVVDSLDGIQDSLTFERIEASGETVQDLNELVVVSQTASGSTLCDRVTEPPLERYPDHRSVPPSPQPRTHRNPALSLENVAAPRGCVSPSVRTRTPLFFSDDEESDRDGGDGLEDDGLEDDTFDANATSFSAPPQSCLSPSMQTMSPSSLYVWLSIHDGISEEVGVENGIAPFLERTVDGGIQLRLDLAMLQWFNPANEAFITPQRLRSFLSRVPNVRVWTYRDPVPFSQCASAPLILGSISPGVSSPELRMLGTPWRVSPVDGDRPHAARFFKLVGSDTGGLLFVIFLAPSTLSPHHAPQSALPAVAPFPPCPSMCSMPPIETWNEVFAELCSLLQQLQSRDWHSSYKHYAVVKFMQAMCYTMGLRASYGSEGGMGLVTQWVISQRLAPYKLLAVQPRTVANWVHLTVTDSERLYIRLKEYVENGGCLPALDTARLFNTLKIWVTVEPAHLIRQGTLTTAEYTALHPPWAERDFHRLVKQHLHDGPWT